jgi:hypothetical protein
VPCFVFRILVFRTFDLILSSFAFSPLFISTQLLATLCNNTANNRPGKPRERKQQKREKRQCLKSGAQKKTQKRAGGTGESLYCLLYVCVINFKTNIMIDVLSLKSSRFSFFVDHN